MKDRIKLGADVFVALLEEQSFSRLADALRSRSEGIIISWTESVKQALPSADRLTFSQLQDHMPTMLAHLADVLASADPEEARWLLFEPIKHATTRFHEQYNLNELVTEYVLLRRIIFEEIELELRRSLMLAENLALNTGLDLLLQHSVVAFVEHQQQELRAAAEVESKYLAFISEDIRNNLYSVTLALELLKRRLTTRPELAEELAGLDAIGQSTLETMSGMDRLLQAERLRQHSQPNAESVELRAVAAEVVAQFSIQAQKKGIALSVEFPASSIVKGDLGWIKLVLQNLVWNAMKHSPQGTVRISAEPRRDAEGWVISVSDEGTGIAEEQVRGLVEAFERGESGGQTGLGLGLAIASQVAKVLGGRLTVESKVGTGSTFRLILPQLKGNERASS
jgi:signal transduction histidine kinase